MTDNALITELENHGARCWQKGYAFWQVPDYRGKRYREAWQHGYDRAEAEFGNTHNGRPGRWEWHTHHGHVGDK